MSERPDAVNVVQAAVQVEIAYSLAGMLRHGPFSNITFANVVGVGHSFGSASKLLNGCGQNVER